MTAEDHADPRPQGFRPDPRPLEPGLHFVATPIGAARDITLRALDILAKADVLAAEDTRTLRHLMEIHGIALGARRIIAYHDHNGDRVRPLLLARLAEGKSVAYASEAGTPLVADPGFPLAREAIAAGHTLRAAPGPSALLAALTVAGLPTDQFHFSGFLPATRSARRRAIADLRAVPGTIVLYESPRRVRALLEDLAEGLGAAREAALCRELTKRFEETRRGSLAALIDGFGEATPKGEFVVLVAPATEAPAEPEDLAAEIARALPGRHVKEVAAELALKHGLNKRDVYQLALEVRKTMEDG
ncbi:16S rRNA (cytidine(1402)-2'-O)-methyltransferase [Szabonella alba]|uniref:Ribosomal RNA small subunit methyltransferase I n=1 Tax=Szabonella alba TaxID=2804194 RepID=A0A8K0V846_9RHOB|nr:16S rRNA (cytidine(1402)-2'-O)-methyltransferase [Szabonella alba]MBL4916011.1 16S rRNA (cytidine(1402)-2'-O)-methyltransferase [Szabonella alba]